MGTEEAPVWMNQGQSDFEQTDQLMMSQTNLSITINYHEIKHYDWC